MSQIDSTTVDVDDIINRIQAVRRGELPEDSVSIEELRAAVTAQLVGYKQAETVVLRFGEVFDFHRQHALHLIQFLVLTALGVFLELILTASEIALSIHQLLLGFGLIAL